ncbi:MULTISPECIES: Bax inhibitor-1 family protein [unclassified Pseudomonas]|uniref:Bax inhibitor-1 family protein n=1 Tax=unclassified Pseudomonas TaxID=196821 RepID=UPI001A9ECBCC|nr:MULTISPECIES: Bax inhibitor-1 family protein [unclassified Pseudomonas]MCE5987121.1 Bax inhibitor-1 family protein [Pseudomonas sp. LM20]MCE5994200.1 Bax inhibitor-1 family protein [Pseudomonas sp. KCA11]
MLENETFNRLGSNHKISASIYNLILGAVLLWGFFVNWYLVITVPPDIVRSIPMMLFLVGYLITALAGVAIIFKSEKPLYSFLGYNLIVIPVGLLLVIVLPKYSHENIVNALQATVLLTVTMMLLGAAFPRFFKRIKASLCIALIAVIFVELAQVWLFGIHLAVMDWITALIFCGYIGVDWGRANQIERTVDNAIDSAASLYLDIINLFLRVLRIVSRK